MIDKSLILHKITNPILLEYIIKYDNEYNEGEKEIRIDCRIFNDTINYIIGYYSPSSLDSAPMIKCEPINGREVTMVFWDYLFNIELSADRALELNKYALSDEEYRKFKKVIIENQTSGIEKDIGIINHKKAFALYFDRNQNLLRAGTLGW